MKVILKIFLQLLLVTALVITAIVISPKLQLTLANVVLNRILINYALSGEKLRVDVGSIKTYGGVMTLGDIALYRHTNLENLNSAHSNNDSDSSNKLVIIQNAQATINVRNFIRERTLHYHITTPTITWNNVKISMTRPIDIHHNLSLLGGKPKLHIICDLDASILPQNEIENTIQDVDFGLDIIVYKNHLVFNKLSIIDAERIERVTVTGELPFRTHCTQHISKDSDGIEDVDGKLHVSIFDMPIDLYKFILHIDHGLYKFLNDSLTGGTVTSGKIDIMIPHNTLHNLLTKSSNTDDNTIVGEIGKVLNKHNVSGEFRVEDFEYRYSKYMPNLQIHDATVSCDGSEIIIKIHDVRIGQNSKSEDAIVKFNWLDDNIIVDALGEVKGEVQDLLLFMNPIHVEKIQNYNLNLHTMNGVFTSKVKITIPTDTKNANIYDIKAVATNVTGKLLGDNIAFSNGQFDAIFDGKGIAITGAAKVYDIPTKVKVLIDFDGPDKNNITVECNTLLNKDIKDPNIVIEDGSTIATMVYKHEDDVSSINATADLTGLQFSVPKLNLTKKKGESAKLVMVGDIVNHDLQSFAYNIGNNRSIAINGILDITKNGWNANINKFIFDKNNFAGTIKKDGSLYRIDIKGHAVDLSRHDWTFSKEIHNIDKKTERIDMNVFAELDNVFMHGDQVLHDTSYSARCIMWTQDGKKDSVCDSIMLDSKIGNSKFSVQRVTDKQRKQHTTLIADNAGDAILAFDINNKLKSGKAIIALDSEIAEDYRIKSITGQMTLRQFTVKSNNFLTKLVSFLSFYGLNMFKSDISFSEMRCAIKGDENGVFMLENIMAEGPYFNLEGKATIDTRERTIDTSGIVMPDLYGINAIVKYTPLGLILSGGTKRGIVFSPYHITKTY